MLDTKGERNIPIKAATELEDIAIISDRVARLSAALREAFGEASDQNFEVDGALEGE